MTDQEFDVMDELYFVTPFNELKSKLQIDDHELKNLLIGLLKKGWVKSFQTIDEEVDEDKLDFENKFREYHYLATKAGLMAHNSK